MGYRSDVLALFYPESGVADKDATFSAFKLIMKTRFKEVLDTFSDEFVWHDNVLEFVCNDVKWYPSYPDVQVFEAMLRDIEGMQIGIAAERCRLGEEYQDIELEVFGDADYRIDVTREVHWS